MAWPDIRRRLAAYHGWIFERRRGITGSMLVLVLLYTALELAAHWRHWAEVNWMIMTGLPVGLLFIWKTNEIRKRFEAMADGLAAHDLLRFSRPGSSPGERDFVENTERRAELRAEAKQRIDEDAALWGFFICAIFVPLCLFVLDLVTGKETDQIKFLLFLIVVPMAFACGLRMGRMACYGWQGLRYQTMEVQDCLVTIAPRLGHPDGSAGLAPIGRFYNHQVGKMAYLIVFLLIWLIILAVFRGHAFVTQNYPPETSHGLLALFGLILLLQFLGFFLPMWSIHRQLGDWKDESIRQNFEEGAQIETGLHQESSAPDPQEHAKLVLRRIDLRQQREDIAGMSLWPVSMDTLRQFWIGKFVTCSIALAASYNDVSDFADRALDLVEAGTAQVAQEVSEPGVVSPVDAALSKAIGQGEGVRH